VGLSWNEIRVRAAAFAEEWKDAHYEKGETQSFYNDFFEVFGVKRRRVASFEEPVKLLGAKAWLHRPVLEGRAACRAEEHGTRSPGGGVGAASSQGGSYRPKA
jgi:hypothetical protein